MNGTIILAENPLISNPEGPAVANKTKQINEPRKPIIAIGTPIDSSFFLSATALLEFATFFTSEFKLLIHLVIL